MKKKLLLYLSELNRPNNVLIVSTLAWLSETKNTLLDNYYDSYHQGIHFPGGDSRNLQTGQLTGGTVCGDRHFEELYFILHNFDVSVISTGESVFSQSIRNLDIPVITVSDRLSVLYGEAFKYFDTEMPQNIVMTGSDFGEELSGLDAYLYPEIYYRRAVGVPDSIQEEELAGLYQDGGRIFCVYADGTVVSKLQKQGYDVEVVDSIQYGDDYASITGRIAQRWKDRIKGWILGDPVLVAHWIPTACEDDLMAVYSVPQEKILSRTGQLISSKGKVVYGRQYSDRDFFELSKLNQCLQVIDPCRPPFQSVKHVEYTWDSGRNSRGFFDDEYSDEELRRFAREGRILISLMFWSGMIREVENFYNLIDLIAMTRLRCGLVVTAQSYEYMMHGPFELLTVSLDRGGVYPHVEPVLGSCGIGVGIESHMTCDRLGEDLKEGLDRISRKVKYQGWIPCGWWATMDTELKELGRQDKPKPFRLLKYHPYVQVRFHAKEKTFDANTGSDDGGGSAYEGQGYFEKLKQFIYKSDFMKYFEPYRPYEFYRPGPLRRDIIETARSVDLRYMFTKAEFRSDPAARYIDDDFIALNYTSGQWDGWTPFETVNDVSDLKTSEKILLKRNRPGWIVSTIDSCLWTFGGEFWKRGNRLFDIARFCSEGGNSKKLINVKPHTVARYARIIEGNN